MKISMKESATGANILMSKLSCKSRKMGCLSLVKSKGAGNTSMKVCDMRKKLSGMAAISVVPPTAMYQAGKKKRSSFTVIKDNADFVPPASAQSKRKTSGATSSYKIPTVGKKGK